MNTTDEAPALSYAILTNLAYADGLRVKTRTFDGLNKPVPSKPVAKDAAKPAAPAKPAADTADEAPADDSEADTDKEDSGDSSDEDLFGDDDF